MLTELWIYPSGARVFWEPRNELCFFPTPSRPDGVPGVEIHDLTCYRQSVGNPSADWKDILANARPTGMVRISSDIVDFLIRCKGYQPKFNAWRQILIAAKHQGWDPPQLESYVGMTETFESFREEEARCGKGLCHVLEIASWLLQYPPDKLGGLH